HCCEHIETGHGGSEQRAADLDTRRQTHRVSVDESVSVERFLAECRRYGHARTTDEQPVLDRADFFFTRWENPRFQRAEYRHPPRYLGSAHWRQSDAAH